MMVTKPFSAHHVGPCSANLGIAVSSHVRRVLSQIAVGAAPRLRSKAKGTMPMDRGPVPVAPDIHVADRVSVTDEGQ